MKILTNNMQIAHVTALDCICLAVSQEQASIDHPRWRAKEQERRRVVSSTLATHQGILHMSFAQPALHEWLLRAWQMVRCVRSSALPTPRNPLRSQDANDKQRAFERSRKGHDGDVCRMLWGHSRPSNQTRASGSLLEAVMPELSFEG